MFPQLTYGNQSSGSGLSNWPGLAAASADALVASTGSDPTTGTPALVANTQPAIVPYVQNTPAVPVGSTNTEVTGGSGVPSVTSVTGGSFNLKSWIGSVISHPSQHIVGVVVLLVIGWWLYKHVLKKF